ncbi:MAG: hypothetical protein GYA45_10280 [Pelolinea sp.]|nr:hypothetical protein [Pelolinea sp.]
MQGTAARQSKLIFEKSVGGKSSKGQSLKKILSLLLPCLIMFLFTAACGAGIANVHPTEATVTDPPATSEPSSTSTATPQATATPALPEGVWGLPVGNDELRIFETLYPVFDENFMGGTWVWRDQRGDIRRYLDPETKHLFARGQSDWDRLIMDIDLDFNQEPLLRGWEVNRINMTDRRADGVLRAISQLFGASYLSQMGIDPTDPELYEYSTWIVYRIVSGSPTNDMQNLVRSSEGNYTALVPYYDQENNQFVFTLYVNEDWKGGSDGLRDYTDFVFWHSLPDYPGEHLPMPMALPSAQIPSNTN